MSLELVNTFGTLLTVAIVAATATAALVLSQDFSRSRTTTYPPGVRRIRVECAWPVPAAV